MKSLGRPTEMGFFGDSNEVTDMAKVHTAYA
jgi:hypothetical protein